MPFAQQRTVLPVREAKSLITSSEEFSRNFGTDAIAPGRWLGGKGAGPCFRAAIGQPAGILGFD